MADLLLATREKSMLHLWLSLAPSCAIMHSLLRIISYTKHQGCLYSHQARRENMAQHALSSSRNPCPRFSLHPRQKVHFSKV